MSSLESNSGKGKRIVTAEASRKAATLMDKGNIVFMLIPPLQIFWFGISMGVYAMQRHHPNPKVGLYTQWAAYRFYGVMGLVIPVGAFFPGKGVVPWLIAWGLGLLIIIPWSIWSIMRVRKDTWEDVEIPEDDYDEDN